MFDSIIENLQSTHIALLVYVVLFIAPILSSIIIVFCLIFLWINLMIYPLLSSKNQQSYKLYFSGIDLSKAGFIMGRRVKQIQKFIADYSDISILSKVNIHSIQKRLTDSYLSIIGGFFRGMGRGIEKGKNKNNSSQQSNTNWKKFRIVQKLIAYIIAIIFGTIFISFVMIVTCFPVIILVILIYRII